MVTRTFLMALALGCAPESPETTTPGPGSSSSTSSTPEPSTPTPTTTDVPYEAAFYPADRVQSPLSDFVVDGLHAIAALGEGRQEDVFAKVGASSTVSRNTLYCFADDPIDLGAHTELTTALETFLDGDAAGATPFDRVTLAAISGRTAGWAIDGPFQDELAAINPRFSLVHYGTNDMGMGATYHSALHPFYDNLDALVQISIDNGTIPVLFGISPRLDNAAANEWVSTYNAAIRGLAQRWQIPFIDLYLATEHLDGQGMSGDGLHLEGFSDGACLLTAEGLEHGYNIRNLIALEALDRMYRTVLLDDGALDDAIGVPGSGGPDDPWQIGTLPFSHGDDTSASPWSEVDVWDCDDADESGPEVYYELEIAEATGVRAVVVDPGDPDIDIHLLDATGACVDRAHQLLEVDLEPGVWRFALDSWTDGDGVPHSGEYQLVVVEM